MYSLDKAGRLRFKGKMAAKADLPTSKKFEVSPGLSCVIVARDLDEQIALANAETPEDFEGFTEALALVRN